jgi:hypothetical protein
MSVSEAMAAAGVGDYDIEMYQVVGMFFYNTHFVDATASASAQGQSNSETQNLISQGDPGVPEPLWYLIPVVLLIGAGYVAARALESRYGSTGEAAKAGATVVAGYFPLAAVGTFLFTASDTLTVGFGQEVSLSMGPSKAMGIVLAGLVYPLVFGAVGGFIADSTGSSTGRASPQQRYGGAGSGSQHQQQQQYGSQQRGRQQGGRQQQGQYRGQGGTRNTGQQQRSNNQQRQRGNQQRQRGNQRQGESRRGRQGSDQRGRQDDSGNSGDRGRR